LLNRWWWGSVLLVNVPIVVVSLILLPIVVPTSRDPHAPGVDIPGAVLSIVGLAVLLYGIIEAPRRGWGSTDTLIALGMGVIVLLAFFAWERHTSQPMLPLDLFRNPRFSAASAALSLTFFALFGFIFLITQYLQLVRGLSPLGAGLRLAPPAVGLMIGAPLAPRIVERVGTKAVVAFGLGLASFSLLISSRTTVLTHTGLLALVFGLFGVGMGMTMAPATESIMGSVPPARAGVGSAINDTTRQAGGAFGVAVLGSVAATRYNSTLGAINAPPAILRTARESIGAALATAAKLPAAQAQQLHAAVVRGFTSGVSLATLAAAAVVACAALVVIIFLPSRARQATRSEATKDDEQLKR
jgi:predicted MFS family arabinose efflux permease